MSTDTTVSTAPGRSRVRAIAAGLLLVLAGLLLAPALVGHWGHRTLVDGERYLATVGPLAESPEVQHALSEAVSGALITTVNTPAVVEDLLEPITSRWPATQALVAPISLGLDGVIRATVDRIVTSDAFITLWIEVNRLAQKGLLIALEGRPGGPVDIEGDQVVLNTGALIDRVKASLVDSGLGFMKYVTITPARSQIVLLDAPQVAQIRTIYSFSAPIMAWAIAGVAVLFALAALMARRRARMVITIGIVICGVMGVLAIALALGERAFVNAFASTPFDAASTVFWTQLVTYLKNSIGALITLGAILVIAGWYAGATRTAARARAALASRRDLLADRLPTGPLTDLGRVMGEHPRVWRTAGILVPTAILVIFGSAEPSAVLITFGIILVVLAAVEVCAASGRREPAGVSPVGAG